MRPSSSCACSVLLFCFQAAWALTSLTPGLHTTQSGPNPNKLEDDTSLVQLSRPSIRTYHHGGIRSAVDETLFVLVDVESCDFVEGEKKSLGSHSSDHEVFEWTNGKYFITPTANHVNFDPDAPGAEVYICTARAAGGWGVHQADCCACNAGDPVSATRTNMYKIGNTDYKCYYDCEAVTCPTTETTAPTATPTSAPTAAPSPTPTPVPSPAPTPAPSAAPTPAPTFAPSPAPTQAPTFVPSPTPTLAPTPAPTFVPSLAPTLAPTPAPSPAPTLEPTPAPTQAPTLAPTPAPTSAPTFASTPAPTPATTTAKPPEVTGDPHVTNLDGVRFNLIRTGTHQLLRLPRETVSGGGLLPLLQVLGRVEEERDCADAYVKELFISGTWLQQSGSLSFRTAGNATQSEGAIQLKVNGSNASIDDLWSDNRLAGIIEEVMLPRAFKSKADEKKIHRFNFLTVRLRFPAAVLTVKWLSRVVPGSSVNHMNLMVSGLPKNKAMDIGGILGHDDHTLAATPTTDCVRANANLFSPSTSRAHSDSDTDWLSAIYEDIGIDN